VSIGRTACGIPFISSNQRGSDRTELSFWTVDGTRLTGPRLIRNCIPEFGALPPETFWYADHPSSSVLRLADGKWHALLAYRVKAYHLPTRMREEPALPQTGCYVEEVISTGTAVGEWRF